MAEAATAKDEEYLGKEKISKLIIKFSIPCIVALVVSALYNIVDQIFIGKKIGELGNAATNIVYPITVIALGLALLFGDGAAAFFSLCEGKKDHESANKSFATALITSLGISLIFILIGYLLEDQLLSLFGATDATYEYAKEYLTIILIGIPFYLMFNTLNPIIRADGSPTYAMLATLLGAVINIILDPIALFVLEWGMQGAAIATVTGQVISFIMEILYFIKPKTLKISGKTFRFSISIFASEARLGLTSFLTQVAQVVTLTVINNLCVSVGSASVYGTVTTQAVMGIVIKVFGIINSIAIGLGAGSQPVIGYNYGAQKYDRVKNLYKYLTIITLCVGAIGTIFFEAGPQLIISLFSNSTDMSNEYYMEFATLCFRIYLCSTMLICYVRTTSIFLQALGKAWKSILLSLMRDFIVILPSLFILAYTTDIIGMLWAPLIADIVSTIVAVVFMYIEFRKMKAAPQVMPETGAVSEETSSLPEESIPVYQSDKPHFVITISREFGSGGRYIGKMLAEKLGVSCYDKEIISLTAKESGFAENYVKEYSEKKKSGTHIGNNDDRMFIAESAVIHNLAERESCVIVGRCADYILQDKKDDINIFNVFIYSSAEGKIKRAVTYYGIDEKEAEKKISDTNKQRAKHYKYYTGRQWGVVSDYDIAMNSDFVGVEQAAEIISNIVSEKIAL